MAKILKSKTIIFVTTNQNKLREVRAMLPDYNVENKTLALPELQGEPEEIIAEKLKSAYRILKMPVIVDDTSLKIDAFGGLPGPYIKDFIEKIGAKRIAELSIGKNKAKAVCIFGYMDSKGMQLFNGELKGRIVMPKGKSGFDWDPIFQPEGFSKTFAQMEASEKNKISHRFKAIKKLSHFMNKVK